MDEEGLADLIEGLGDRVDLSAYEIEAYLAVLEAGSMTASTIAEQTSIPQPRVYDTVRKLNERGLVELHETRPMTAVAIEPTESFEGVIDSVDQLVSRLQRRYTTPDPDREAVSLVKSRATILRYIGQIIDGSEYDLSLSLTPRLISRYEAQLRSARERDVAIELLVTPRSRAPDPSRFQYTEIATTVRGRRGITTPVIAVGDGEHSVYATQDAIRDDNDHYGVIFNRSELGFLVAGFFNTILWTTAEPIASADLQIRFPRRYASIRRCVKDLQALEGPFSATVDGRWVDTGDPCRLEGTVLDLAIEETGEVASLTLSTAEGQVTIGGRLAAFEDIEAHEIVVHQDGDTG